MANHKPTFRNDIAGKIFNNLQAIEIDHVDKHITSHGRLKYTTYWKCKCLLCGNMKVVSRAELVRGRVNSCGCLSKSVSVTTGTKSPSTHPLYKIHQAMIRRCYVPTAQHYEIYGGRGIYVCNEWYTPGVRGNPGFIVFRSWAYANGYIDPVKGHPNPLSIDRIDNNGPYAPWNCRWITRKIQGENRTANIYIIINGVRKTLKQAAIDAGIRPNNVYDAHSIHGWSLDALAHRFTHPELGLHKSTKTGYYMDSEGFMVLIPKTQEERI